MVSFIFINTSQSLFIHLYEGLKFDRIYKFVIVQGINFKIFNLQLSISTRMNEFYENLERINSVDEIKISHNATLLKISDDLFIKNTFVSYNPYISIL